MTLTAHDALAAWDDLDPDRDRVQQMMDESDKGHGSYEEADSARFDLWQNEAAVGDSLAVALRDLTARRDLALHRLTVLASALAADLGPAAGDLLYLTGEVEHALNTPAADQEDAAA